ncbi:phage tail assembly protein [Alkalihalophilus pseudofirmus]|uniref:phage tail assembly protein n=1 Tax=Alkalihalophilus pseudofirmus TaxID=79885 RepID=UPI0009FA7643
MAETKKETKMRNEYKLYKEVEFEGKKYSSLDLDFDSLTGSDLEEATIEVSQMGDANTMMFTESSKLYQAAICARAAKVPVQLIRKLHPKDYTGVTIQAYAFLTN